MKNITHILFSIILLFGLSSCQQEDEPTGGLNKDEGLMIFDLSTYTSPAIEIRASFPNEDVDINNYIIKIIDIETTDVKKESTYRELMEEGGKVKLIAGRYRVVAYNYDGAAVAVSERPFFLGQTEFQILAAKTTTVHTTCRLQNIEVALSLSDYFVASVRDNYAIAINNGAGGVHIFTKDNIAKKAYFGVPENASSIQLRVIATSKDNIGIDESYVIIKPVNSENSSVLEKGDSFHIVLDIGDDRSIDIATRTNRDIMAYIDSKKSNVNIFEATTQS